MEHLGHPIVGDYTYAADKLSYRMFLHAASLELPLAELRSPEEGPLRMESPVDWPGVFEPSEPLRLPADHPEAGRLVAGLFGGEEA